MFFESIASYNPVLGVTPATDGIPNAKTIPVITAVFGAVTATFVASIPAAAVIASVFADICTPWPNIFSSCKSLLVFIYATFTR